MGALLGWGTGICTPIGRSRICSPAVRRSPNNGYFTTEWVLIIIKSSMVKKVSNVLPDFEHFVKGENPTLLIHSGTHGDEYGVIDIVRKCVEKYEDRLPDFVFVPKVSPSAVKAKIRVNSNGFDLNRIFFSDSKEIEVIENIKALDGYKFDTMVSFHEDPVLEEYYIYDSGFDLNESEKIKSHNQKLKKMGFKLLNGLDDPDDPNLGYEFKEGYRKFIEGKDDKSNGMITVWAMVEKGVNECLVPEIPGILSMEKKELIVDTFFKDLLIKEV